jgi:CheY-like chemotaxis protein
MGLGLPICSNFVTLMGGNISVKSTLKKGSCFSFNILVLPIDKIEKTTINSNQVIRIAPKQKENRILVVEDVKENRLLLTELLREVGFKVRSAKNGLEGIELWESWQPHLIWMDIRMPEMSGYEATQRIRKFEGQTQKTIIIALTASASANTREKLLNAGCNDFVTKPFHQDTIFDKITKYLGVKYIYEESSENFGLSFDSFSYNLTPAVFEGLPQDLLIQLEEAAAMGHSNKVREIINQLPDSHQELANSLTELVNKFRLDRISESLDIVINK